MKPKKAPVRRAALALSLPLLILACSQNAPSTPVTTTDGAGAGAEATSEGTLQTAAISEGMLQTAATGLRDTRSDTWVGTDALGRGMPLSGDVGLPKAGKFVGIFYHLWEPGEEVFDNTKIAAGQGSFGPRWSFHWWGEPYLGYYYRDDEYVIRKHAQMLSDAGVDTIIVDTSNGEANTQKDFGRILKLCEVYTQMRAEGRKTPAISFLTGEDTGLSGPTTNYLYDNFYKPGKYSDLWFRWQGKPLILANKQTVKEEARNFLTIRRSWAWHNPKGWFGDGRDSWPWLDSYPQQPGWHDSPSHPEEIALGVGEGPLSNKGRSFHAGAQPSVPTPNQGLYFAEQWRRALEVNPDFILIAGWNEWIAQRFIHGQDSYAGPMAGRPLKDGDSYFVDNYSQEYSRDIEPMRGGYGDNYYAQMVQGIRRFKGVRAVEAPSAAKSISINADFSQWNGVGPLYLDDIGDTTRRNRPGNSQRSYVNTTGRNDLAVMQVARDAQNLYFHARTTQTLSAAGNNWMTLYLNTDGNGGNGWNGFDYAVNRTVRNGSTGVLERFVNGGWQAVADVKFISANNELHFSVSRDAVGLGTARGPLNFDFKWADNGPVSGDPIAFLDQGDAAPNGRFSYRYQENGVTLPPPAPPTGLLPLDGYRSLRVTTTGFTNKYLRHIDGLGRTEVVDGSSAPLIKQDTTFKIVRGLGDGNCYSFQARSYPNSYLRHQAFRLKLATNDNSEVFKQDATFCARTGLSGTGVSLEAKNLPGTFVRHIDSEVWLAKKGAAHAWDATPNFEADASWNVATPWAP